jgi:hypothetical protein
MKMDVIGQLDADGSKRFATLVGRAYVIGAIGAACAGLAALVWAVRWW